MIIVIIFIRRKRRFRRPSKHVEDNTVDYEGEELEIGFNVSYILDVLNTLKTEKVLWTLGDSNSSALIEGVDDSISSLYVVMPMRL